MANGVSGCAKRLMKRTYTHNPYRHITVIPVSVAGPCDWARSHEAAFGAPVFAPNRGVDVAQPPHTYGEPASSSVPCHEGGMCPRSMTYARYGAAPYACPATAAYEAPMEVDESINTSIGADKTVNLSNSTVSCCNAGTPTTSTPNKGSNTLYKMYVDGRPKVVRGVTRAEVSVKLRLGNEVFLVDDVPAVLGAVMVPEELVGRYVIVEGDRGEDLGCIASVSHSGARSAGDASEAGRRLARVLREATAEELEAFQRLDELEESALRFCRAAVQSLNLRVPLQVERAVFQFDRKKLTFTYSSDSYVEFKTLLRALNRQYQCRIWMHQLNWDMNCRDKRQSAGGEGEGRKRSGLKDEGGRRCEAGAVAA